MKTKLILASLDLLALRGKGADTRREAAREANELRAREQRVERELRAAKTREERDAIRTAFEARINEARRFFHQWCKL